MFPTTFEQFIDSIRGILPVYDSLDSLVNEIKIDWLDRPSNSSNYFVGKYCEVGGSSGGSCWDSSDDPQTERYSTGERLESPEIMIYEILKHVGKPNIKFNFYMEEILPLVVYSDYNINEYYGNYKNNKCFNINLNKLYLKLKIEMRPGRRAGLS